MSFSERTRLLKAHTRSPRVKPKNSHSGPASPPSSSPTVSPPVCGCWAEQTGLKAQQVLRRPHLRLVLRSADAGPNQVMSLSTVLQTPAKGAMPSLLSRPFLDTVDLSTPSESKTLSPNTKGLATFVHVHPGRRLVLLGFSFLRKNEKLQYPAR